MNDPIPFFSDLRIAAIPAVQRLYDAAQNEGYSLPKLYSDLVSGLNKAGEPRRRASPSSSGWLL